MSEQQTPEGAERYDQSGEGLPEQERVQGGTDEQAQRPHPVLSEELEELGQHLETTFRAAVKAIQQRAPSSHKIEERARRAAQEVQEAPLVRELESVLVSGLHQINQQLRRVVERFDAEEQESAASPQTAQRLRIDQEPADEEPQPGGGQAPPE